MIYTGERLIPDSFTIADRILIEHLNRYSFAAKIINLRQQQRRHGQQPGIADRTRILDAPCGAGYGAALLAEQVGASVMGIDNDEGTITYARQRYGTMPGLLFCVADLDSEIPHDLDAAPFDAVVCFEGIEHVLAQEDVARRLCAATVPGGLVIVSTPRRGGPGGGSEFHTRELVRTELHDLFAPHLASVQMYGQDITVGDCDGNDSARYYVLVGMA